ncbi:MAG: ADOP family duplicated permease [Longimicrobiales bacterium]
MSDADVEEELRFHVDSAAERNLARGMRPDVARREALVRLGGVDRTLESTRDVMRWRWLEDAWQDGRQALRQLRRNPAFAIAAVCTLALGIGANTAIFSVLDAVLLRPLPYAEPEELVTYQPGRYENYRGWTEGVRSLQASGAYTYSVANVTGGDEPVRVWTLAVTSSLLPALGRPPLLGRNFTEEDDVPGAPRRVLLRHGFWRAYFAGDPGLVGRTIEVNDAAHEVIGILPPDLTFPPPARRSDGSMPTQADVWTGVGWLSDLYERGGFLAIGRLSDGASAEVSATELTAAANTLRAAGEDPLRVVVQNVSEAVIAPLRPAVLTFAGGVMLVLLIGCANLGNLLLARLAGRQRELALRVSLGARPGRVVRQILTEGAVLAGGGAVLGAGVGWLLLRTLLWLAPQELARIQNAALNGRVLAFTLVVSIVAAAVIGVLPAWRAQRRDPREALSSTRGSAGDRNAGRVQGVVVACEIALAVVLLIGGSLLLRSFAALANVNPGFDTDGLVTADLLIPSERYESRATVLQFFDRLEDRFEAHPGIRSASAIDRLPYGPSWSQISFNIAGRPSLAGSGRMFGYNTAARPDYFRTIGILIVEGREFASTDGTDAPPVVIIGNALADQYWPGTSPLGERIEVFGVMREIVGVAGDVRHLGPSTPVDPLIYLPQAQDVTTRRMMTIVLRTNPASPISIGEVRAGIHALDDRLAISNLRNFDALRSQRTAGQRFNALLVASFAMLAALLAAVGIHGVMSFVVAQRTREIGIRMALGATRMTVLGTFLGNAMRAVLAGTVAGVAVALPLTRLVQSMLFGITATDAIAYLGVVLFVMVLALVAAFVPARRAASVAPSTALAN